MPATIFSGLVVCSCCLQPGAPQRMQRASCPRKLRLAEGRILIRSSLPLDDRDQVLLKGASSPLLKTFLPWQLMSATLQQQQRRWMIWWGDKGSSNFPEAFTIRILQRSNINGINPLCCLGFLSVFHVGSFFTALGSCLV